MPLAPHKTHVLILVRHAHRDTTDRRLDNGLTAKGRAQAQAVRRFFDRDVHARLRSELRVLSSPKKRCRQTVEAIAKYARRGLEVEPGLAEQAPGESVASMRRRARRFIKAWRDGRFESKCIVACSHGDWLPEALHAATGVRANLKKGGWARIEREGKRQPWLVTLLQEP